MWSDAPEEVIHLRYPHRHLFYVTVEVEVGHDNRDVEFFILQDHLRSVMTRLPIFKNMPAGPTVEWSCERVAETIAGVLESDFGYHARMVEVSEDGESSGIWYAR